MWCGGWWTSSEFMVSYDGNVDGWDAGHMLPSNASRIIVTSDMFYDDVAKAEMMKALRHNNEFRLATAEELSNIQLQHQLPLLMAIVHK